MALDFPERVGATTTTTGTGTITLSTAIAQYQGTSALTDAKEYEYFIEDADGSGWESGRGTYTLTGTTLSRATIYDSSNSGSAITLSAGTHNVFIGHTARRAHINDTGSRGHIDGLQLTYATTTTLTLNEGRAIVNGEALEVTSATTTKSGDAIGTSAILYVYVYNNSGTVQMHWEMRASSADDPVWDNELDYAKHPVDGAGKRFIGAVYVNSSSQFDTFQYSANGRERTYYPDNKVNRFLTNVTQTTCTTVSIATICPPPPLARAAYIKLHVKNTAVSAGERYVLLNANTTQCSNNAGLQVSAYLPASSAAAALGPLRIELDTTSFFYICKDTDTDMIADMIGWEMYV